jgi:glycosyltransferase 2 family protein
MQLSTYISRYTNTTLYQWLRPLIFFLGLTFFVALVANSWQETRTFLSNITWNLFLIAAIIGIADHFIVSLVFQRLLKKYNVSVAYPVVGKMYFYGQMAKYIPGRFWSILYQRSFVELPGATSALLFTNVELLAMFIVRNTFTALALLLAGVGIALGAGVYAVGALVFWVVGRSDSISRVVYWIANYISYPMEERELVANSSNRFGLPFLYLMATITFLSSNFLMMYATFNFSMTESYLYIAFLGLAWVIGVLTIVVPAGIGVRELTFVALAGLSGAPLSLETLTVIAVVYRFWHMLQEVGGVLLASLVSKLRSR